MDEASPVSDKILPPVSFQLMTENNQINFSQKNTQIITNIRTIKSVSQINYNMHWQQNTENKNKIIGQNTVDLKKAA